MRVIALIAAVLPLAASFSVPKVASQSRLLSQDFALNAEANGATNGEAKKKVMVLGGDGFCGWPTSLYLSDQGHDIVIVDNLSRRKIDLDLGCDSLTPIASMEVCIL
jgi:UDP-sulfoquinovose synthase